MDLKVFSNHPSDRELINYTYSIFKNKWHTSFDYSQTEPVKFMGKQINDKFKYNKEAIRYFAYCAKLFETFHDYKGISYYEREGGLCLYLSVLLYWLLWSIGLKDELYYCQGIYRHNAKENIDPLALMMFGEEFSGLHTWIEYKGSILDVSIAQERDFFDFKGNFCYILGEVPKGMTFLGYRENSEIAKMYAREIAKYEGKTFYDWLNYHKENAKQI